MILPLSVDHFERDIRDRLPRVLRSEAAFGEQDVEMRIVVAWATGCLEDDDGPNVEINA